MVGWGIVCAGVAPAHAATPDVVRDRSDANELQPAASGDYLVWSQGRSSYVKHEDDPRVRLNASGTRSFNATIDGTTVVYQSIGDRGSRLRVYDALSGERSRITRGVNTPAFETEPSLSGDWLLFTRVGPSRAKVVLFDLVAGTQRILADLTTRHHYLISDQVNDDWATWESCDYADGRYSNCQVHRYRISTQHAAVIPNTGRQQYAAGVDSDGTVYLVSTGGTNRWTCGERTKLVRQPRDGARKVIATLPDGVDSFNTFAFEETDGSVDLLFERLRCADGASGIYEVEDADTI